MEISIEVLTLPKDIAVQVELGVPYSWRRPGNGLLLDDVEILGYVWHPELFGRGSHYVLLKRGNQLRFVENNLHDPLEQIYLT